LRTACKRLVFLRGGTDRAQAEVRAFLRAATQRPTALRRAIGVGLGIRQGEALGLRRSYADLEAGHLKTWWQLQRLTWRRGCEGPHKCGERLHRFEPIPPPLIPLLVERRARQEEARARRRRRIR